MKKSVVKQPLLVFAATVALFAAPQIAHAQDAPAQDSAGQEQSGRHRRSPDEVVAMLDSKLSLSDDQKAKIKPIIEERQQKMQALAGSGAAAGKRLGK